MANKVEADWQCPSCGAGTDAKAKDCCDYCILTIFSEKHSPDLDTAFFQYNSISDWEADKVDYSESEME